MHIMCHTLSMHVESCRFDEIWRSVVMMMSGVSLPYCDPMLSSAYCHLFVEQSELLTGKRGLNCKVYQYVIAPMKLLM